MEDEEHVMFGCPEYDICRQKYLEICLGTHKNIKNVSIFDNQEIVAHFLWDIRMTRINSDMSIDLVLSF